MVVFSVLIFSTVHAECIRNGNVYLDIGKTSVFSRLYS